MSIESIATVLTALATLGLFVAAILTPRLFLPILRIRVYDPQGEIAANEGRQAVYFHLEISNKRTVAPAREARVYLEKLWRFDSRQKAEKIQLPGPLPLRWQVYAADGQFRTIGPPAICDLCMLKEEKKLVMMLDDPPAHFRQTFGERCVLIMKVLPAAENARLHQQWVRIAWDGNYPNSEETLGDHIQVWSSHKRKMPSAWPEARIVYREEETEKRERARLEYVPVSRRQ